MGTDVHFYNSIIGNFIVYQDRIETDLLKLCVQPENLEWFSVISVIIHEVNIVAKRKQAQLSNDSFVFYTFPLRSIILLPPLPYRCSSIPGFIYLNIGRLMSRIKYQSY